MKATNVMLIKFIKNSTSVRLPVKTLRGDSWARKSKELSDDGNSIAITRDLAYAIDIMSEMPIENDKRARGNTELSGNL